MDASQRANCPKGHEASEWHSHPRGPLQVLGGVGFLTGWEQRFGEHKHLVKKQ